MAHRTRTVAGAMIGALARMAARGGVDPEEFRRAAQLPRADLLDPSARVPSDRYRRALALAEPVVSPEPERPELLDSVEEGLPLLLCAWLNAPTAAAALEAFAAYLPLLSELDHLRVARQGRELVVEHRSDLPAAYGPIAAVGCFLLLVRVLRDYPAGAAARFSTELAMGSGRIGGRLEEFLGGPVRLGCAANRLRVAGLDLEAPSGRHNPALAPLVARNLDEQLAELRREESTSRLVERALARTPVTSQPAECLGTVCAALGLSRWTLQRRLAAEGTSFKALRLRAALGEATRLLEETALPVAEVAARLGFSSRTSFTHFFHREAGRSPAQVRRGARPGR